MARVIGEHSSNNRGENLFVDKAVEYFDDEAVIYRNRQIFGKEFDVCVLIPRKGILVVEVKGWRENSVIRVDADNSIVIRAQDGEVKSNPQKQVRGYRFALENFIRRGVGLRALVFQMVSLPQISTAFFKKHRLDTVLEESFTLLKEDHANKAAFFRKVSKALAYASQWNRDVFSEETMLKTRGLFEAEVDCVGSKTEIKPSATVSDCRQNYSRFYYIPSDDKALERTVVEMTEQYLRGCKLYCVFSSMEQLSLALSALDVALTERGIRRNRENLENVFEEETPHFPAYPGKDGLTGFHFAFSLLNRDFGLSHPPLFVADGKCDDKERAFLTLLSEHSAFNAEQYFVEHADCNKNIMIRAGAGTGKTYAMISRIAYICHTQKVPLADMAERILMITFTNEAAEQMALKLKAYFRNLCVLCANQSQGREYLTMISRIDQMQISTIHSYAKTLMSRLGAEFGYGIDLSVTSSEYQRRKKIMSCLDRYIQEKRREVGRDYVTALSMPVYEIRDNILDFIGKLRNQSVNVSALKAENFGTAPENSAFHELLFHVIPTVEREYENELLEDGKIHLGALMSSLRHAVYSPSGLAKLREMSPDGRQFLFVDEFQDTDDVQIDILLKIASALDCRMFLVGDIKQCIYRFRGAEEKAFDRVGAEEHPNDWLQFSLCRNYRTDRMLLDIFDKSFANWNAQGNSLLEYRRPLDRLIGVRDYNGYLERHKDKFYRCLSIRNENERIPALIEEIRRIQRRVQYDTEQGRTLYGKEKSVAILVRENWQAELIRAECAKQNITVETNTGGDLYASQPALDMLTLVNALVHFDEADYLYALLRSNFFRVDLPKSNLYHIRTRIREGGWRSQTDEKEIADCLMDTMSILLSRLPGHHTKWEYLIQRLRIDPVLQVMREIYNALEPWKKFAGSDLRKQHEYQLNVDLLFEQIINACNIDRLTVNTLREHLFSCVLSHASVESRRPPEESDEILIQCVTAHKAKGLEYGHVILPYCSFRMDSVKASQLHVNAEQTADGVRIGYSIHMGNHEAPLQNSCYDQTIEAVEKSREEARILYVAMTRAIRSFSWIELQGRKDLCWQNLIDKEV